MEDSLEIKIQDSFQRFGVPLQDRSVQIIAGVRGGYGVTHLCNTLFKKGAEAVLQERDPVESDKFMISAVFPSESPAIK